MVRNIIGVVVGLIVGFIVVSVGLGFGMWLYPNEGEAVPADMPVSQVLFVMACEFVGSTIAIAVTGVIARHQIVCATLVGIFFLGAAVVNLISIPHPQWMAVSTPFAYTIAVFLGLGFATWISDRSQNPGEEPPAKSELSK